MPNYFEADMEAFRAATERINRLMPIEAEAPEHMARLTRAALVSPKGTLIMVRSSYIRR